MQTETADTKSQGRNAEVRRPGRREGFWGHALVAVSACVLTVSIAGSAAYLSYRLYERHTLQQKVRDFVASLGNRTDAELAQDLAELRARPKLARQILPELVNAMNGGRSERDQVAALRLSRAFLDHRSVVRTLLVLASDSRESVAAEAAAALALVQPPERAAGLLATCLTNVSGAVVDEVCDGLLRLDEIGRAEMTKHLPKLSIDRRVWLVGLVQDRAGPSRRSWLELLAADPEPAVRDAARNALTAMTGDPRSGNGSG